MNSNIVSLLNDYPLSNLKQSHFSSADEIASIQGDLLSAQIMYAQSASPFYKDLFRNFGVSFNESDPWGSLDKIPFTQKNDFTMQNCNFLCARKSDVRDICLAASSNMINPAFVPLAASDIARLAHNMACVCDICGVGPDDSLMCLAPFERASLIGLAFQAGSLKNGFSLLRMGDQPAPQIWSLVKAGACAAMAADYEQAAAIAAHAEEIGLDPSKTDLRHIMILNARLYDEDLRKVPAYEKLAEKYHCEIYGLNMSDETASVFAGCGKSAGAHIIPETAVVEIVNERGKRAQPGEIGEIAVTSLGVTAAPVIRYKTGDFGMIVPGECPCGRRSPRVLFLGRKSRALKIKGKTLFPEYILGVAESIDNVAGACLEAFTAHEDMSDRLRLHIVLRTAENADGAEKRIEEKLKACGKSVDMLDFITPEELDKMSALPNAPGKRFKFIDSRENARLRMI